MEYNREYWITVASVKKIQENCYMNCHDVEHSWYMPLGNVITMVADVLETYRSAKAVLTGLWLNFHISHIAKPRFHVTATKQTLIRRDEEARNQSVYLLLACPPSHSFNALCLGIWRIFGQMAVQVVCTITFLELTSLDLLHTTVCTSS